MSPRRRPGPPPPDPAGPSPGRELAERFLQDLSAAWVARGASALEQVMIERPQDVVRIVASLTAGRTGEAAADGLAALSEAELEAVLAAARSALNAPDRG